MPSYTFKRTMITIGLVLPIWVAFNLMANLIFCGLAGPWGSGLEGLEGQEQPEYIWYMSLALRILLIVGPIIIAWCWSGRLLGVRKKLRR